MSKLNETEIVDRIYEAAVVAPEWPSLLSEFAVHIGGFMGMIFTSNPGKTAWVTSPGYEDRFERYIASGFSAQDPRISRAIERGLVGQMVSDLDLFTPDEIANDPMYQYFRTRGAGWAVGCMFNVPSGDAIVLSFERAQSLGPYDRATIDYTDRFRPHFARAALMAARLGLERIRAATDALKSIGLAAAVTGFNKKIISANSLFQELMPSQVQDRRDRVRLTHPGSDQLLANALDEIARKGNYASILSIPVPAREDRPAFVLHTVPIRRPASDIFTNAHCLLVATPLTRKEAPPVALLQGLFDLTPAEARVAHGLAGGDTLTELAPQFGVEVSTLRVQLKSVFTKTGLSRQSDLVALLSGITLRTPDT